MKHLTRIIFVLVLVSFVLAPFGVLDAADKEVKKEKAGKCCKVDKLCCPGCKKEIKKDEAKFKVEYKGKTFYFCSEECKAKFEKDPEKFAKCCADHKDKVYYVCPMKKCDVKSEKPGKCPKCGMELKKMTKSCDHHKHEKKDEHKHEHKHGDDHKH